MRASLEDVFMELTSASVEYRSHAPDAAPAPNALAAPDERKAAMTIAVPTDTRHRRSGLSHAMRAEWTKLATLRSTKWAILLIAFAGTVLVSFLSTNGARHQSANFYQDFDPTNQALAGFALASLVIGI